MMERPWANSALRPCLERSTSNELSRSSEGSLSSRPATAGNWPITSNRCDLGGHQDSTMEEFIFTAFVLAFGVGVHLAVRRLHSVAEGRLLDLGLIVHVVAGFAQILIYRYYYAGGDELAYHLFASRVADGLRYDFANIFPQTIDVALHREHHIPFDLMGGGSTGTMQMIAAWLLFGLGNSLFAVTTVIAIGSYVSKVTLYHALRAEFGAQENKRVLMACMFVPTAVFWTAALLKEPMVMVFFGPTLLGIRWLIDGRRLLLAVVIVAIGAVGMSLLKPYVVLAAGAGTGVWVAWARVLRNRGSIVMKPGYLAAGIGLIVGGYSVAQQFFPQLKESGIGQSMAQQRRASAGERGGSNYALEEGDFDAESTEGTSMAAQVALAPLALVTALFRPFLVEARNAMQALNALETTWLLMLTLQVFNRNGLQRLVQRVMSSPGLMMCLTFTLVLGLGTGLASANLGALSRYRAPMLPFFVLMLLHLRDVRTGDGVNRPQPKLRGGRVSA